MAELTGMMEGMVGVVLVVLAVCAVLLFILLCKFNGSVKRHASLLIKYVTVYL